MCVPLRQIMSTSLPIILSGEPLLLYIIVCDILSSDYCVMQRSPLVTDCVFLRFRVPACAMILY